MVDTSRNQMRRVVIKIRVGREAKIVHNHTYNFIIDKSIDIISSHLSLPALKLSPDVVIRQFCPLPPQHLHPLLMAHLNLTSHRHQTRRQIIVFFLEHPIREHYVVDITEYECVLERVEVSGFEKGGGVIAPVTKWVEMVRSVIAIVESVAIALRKMVC